MRAEWQEKRGPLPYEQLLSENFVVRAEWQEKSGPLPYEQLLRENFAHSDSLLIIPRSGGEIFLTWDTGANMHACLYRAKPYLTQ